MRLWLTIYFSWWIATDQIASSLCEWGFFLVYFLFFGQNAALLWFVFDQIEALYVFLPYLRPDGMCSLWMKHSNSREQYGHMLKWALSLNSPLKQLDTECILFFSLAFQSFVMNLKVDLHSKIAIYLRLLLSLWKVVNEITSLLLVLWLNINPEIIVLSFLPLTCPHVCVYIIIFSFFVKCDIFCPNQCWPHWCKCTGHTCSHDLWSLDFFPRYQITSQCSNFCTQISV